MGLEQLIGNYREKRAAAEQFRRESYALDDRAAAETDRDRAAVLRGEAVTARLRYDNAARDAYWMAVVVEPLAQAVAAELGTEYEVSGPFGLGTHVYLMFKRAGEAVGSLVVSPWALDREDAGLLYDTGRRTSEFAPGTIGELNGGNYVEELLPDSFAAIAELARRKDDSGN